MQLLCDHLTRASCVSIISYPASLQTLPLCTVYVSAYVLTVGLVHILDQHGTLMLLNIFYNIVNNR